jgi:hypothetical protein
MNEKDFQKLVERNKYQIFSFSCPAVLPFSIGIHPWIVVNMKGDIHRYEILHRKNKSEKCKGHLHIDFLPPSSGLEISFLSNSYHWNSTLNHVLEGDENSLASKIGLFMNDIIKIYPYSQRYSFVLGPNSNTFIQWIIDKFPKTDLKLPWRAIGKNYKYR